MTTFYELAKRSLEARARLFEEYKSVNTDANLTDADKRARLEVLDKDITAKGEELRDFTAKAEAEAENRSVDTKLAALMGKPGGNPTASPEEDPEEFRKILIDMAERRGGPVNVYANKQQLTRANGANVQAQAGTVANPTWAGNTTSVIFVNQVLESIRERSPFINLATVFNTENGEILRYPVKNTRIGPTNVGGPMTEGQQITFANGSFGTTQLGAKKYAVGTQLSYELMTDSEVDIVSIVAQDAGEAIGDFLSLDMLSNMQAAVPTTKKVVKADGPAATTPVSYSNMIDTYHTLRTAYRNSATWYMGDLQMAAIRKLTDTQGHPLWVPALNLGAADMLLGRPVVSDATLTSIANATNTDVLWFGNFSWFKVRQVRGITVSRSDEYAWDSDMSSWKVTWRGDGNLMDLQAVACLRTAAA
ncbi:phage major capsid protein [Streptacidiphilus albus]|uniref:phage major capsid protein n=1 Tax=Streptacidiphilus albus TaxID=105425 RepID=UPI00054C28CB|nr:phage major capsid protein [Streptacidiphilus albus]